MMDLFPFNPLFLNCKLYKSIVFGKVDKKDAIEKSE
jgi:hypothetical protein